MFLKKVLLKISQYSQENTCVGASLVSLESTLLKRDSSTDTFCEYYEIFKNTYSKEHLKTTAETVILKNASEQLLLH